MAVTSATALLLVAACSSAEPEPSGPGHGPEQGGQGTDQPANYDFSEETFGPVESVLMQVPEEIVAEDESFARSRDYTAVKLTALDIESPRFCGVHVVYDVADTAWEEMIEEVQYPVSDIYREEEPVPREIAEEVAANRLAGEPSGNGDWGEPDLENPAKGTWASEERTEKWVIGDCATSWDEDEALTSVAFTKIGFIGGRAARLAEAKVVANNSGQLVLVDGGVKGWEQDMNGDWIPN